MEFIKGYKSSGEETEDEGRIGLLKKRKRPTKKELKKNNSFITKKKLRSVKIIDCSKCPYNCNQMVSKDQQEKINALYWNSSKLSGRKSFILSNVEKDYIKRRYSPNLEKYRKQVSFKYHFTDEMENKVRVCRSFFLATLGYNRNSDAILRTCFNFDPNDSPDKLLDKRGLHKRKEQQGNIDMAQHILSYNPENHYQREKCPDKLYLPHFLTIKQMYKDFLETRVDTDTKKSMSYEIYRQTLRKRNISFCKLGVEECEECVEFFQHEVESGHTRNNLSNDCAKCDYWWDHIQRAGLSRHEYKQDALNTDQNKIFVSSDMQKVMMLPREPGMKRVMFSHRLSLYNQSFAHLGDIKKLRPIAALWHSALQGRGATEIASTFVKFLIKYR
jgi:hypothetical protein